MKYITLLAFLICLAACSQNEPPARTEAPAPVADRSDLDQYVVQNDKTGDGNAAAKATREGLLKELQAAIQLLEKAETLHDAFRVAEAIEDLGREIAPELQAAVPGLPELPRIAGWRAVWTLGSLSNKGWDKGVDGLLAIVTSDGAVENRVAAAEVLGAVASERHKEKLAKALKEQVFTPEVKVQLAVALWRTNKDPAATKVLRDMLTSENDSFKIQAAVALGEINQLTFDAKPILEQIADEPTLRGRTAKRALDFERAIKRFEAILGGTAPGVEKIESIETKMLDSVEKMLKERYIYPDAIAGRKLLYAAASGMLNGLDPYTCLLEDSQLRDAGEIRRFAVPTLGITLGSSKVQANREVRLTRVLSVRPDSGAYRAGLRPGDRIYRVVRGVSAEQVHKLRGDSSSLGEDTNPFQLLPLDEAVSQFSGPVGATVGLNVMRDGWLLSRWVHVTHEELTGEGVKAESLPGGIGMISVWELSAASPNKVKESLTALKDARAIILDLRNCAGGSVDAATRIAGLFLPKGTLVTFSKGRSEELAKPAKYETANDAPDTKTPLVVLINGGTADAGEVLAGALHQHKRARTAGANTFGRAIVQKLIPLTATELEQDGRSAALLLTVARYHGPVSELAYYDRGVEADTQLTPKLFEGWIYDAFDVIGESKDFTSYVDKLRSELDADKLKQVAAGDGRNSGLYPGFDDMYAKFKATHISKEDVRFLLRTALRKRLLEDGVDIQIVDLQEDNVFVGAVKEAAKAAGIDLSEIPEYRTISK